MGIGFVTLFLCSYKINIFVLVSLTDTEYYDRKSAIDFSVLGITADNYLLVQTLGAFAKLRTSDC